MPSIMEDHFLSTPGCQYFVARIGFGLKKISLLTNG